MLFTKYRSRALTMGLVTLKEETPESSLPPSPFDGKVQRENATWKLGKEPSLETEYAGTFIADFYPLKLWEN